MDNILDNIPAKDFIGLALKDKPEDMSKLQEDITDIINLYMDGNILIDILSEKGWTMRKFLYAVSRFPNIAAILHEARLVFDESFKQKLASIVHRAAKDDEWRAAAWLLERKFPKEYGRNINHTIETTENDDPIAIGNYTNAEYDDITD